jgi:hypothetical protein
MMRSNRLDLRFMLTSFSVPLLFEGMVIHGYDSANKVQTRSLQIQLKALVDDIYCVFDAPNVHKV